MRIALPIAVLLLLMLAGALALDSRWVGLAVVHHVARQAQREIRIEGAVHSHLFSLAPYLSAENVTISNPPWVSRGTAARVGRLTLFLRWTSFHHPLDLHALEMRAATVSLLRDAAGRSNWQWGAPGTPVSPQPPILYGLAVPDAEVRLDDDTLHLHFAGKISACEAGDVGGRRPCRVQGRGQLNGRPASFAIDGEPLATARRGAPYHFAFEETSADSRLEGRGVLPRAFDFSQLDVTFAARGPDLKDLYVLTGLTLIDTGAYRLQGELHRRGDRLAFRNLAASSGRSDMSGAVLVRIATPRSVIEAELGSRVLRLKDLGARAAGRAPPPPAQPRLLLPDTPFGLQRFRGSHATLRFEAHRLDLGRLELEGVKAQIAFGQSAILVRPLSATLAGGELSGDLRIEVAPKVPVVTVDLRGADLGLAKLLDAQSASPPRTPPALEGPLDARLTMSAHGDSLHAIAATADGRLAAVLPHGEIRASIAQLAGLDFMRLLGLMLGTSAKEATVRCGIASLQARGGALALEQLMINTGPAIITGGGEVDLRSESLDLRLRDQPTHVRLLGKRLPVRIGGTLRHPSLSVEGSHALGKIGATALLGAVLTPVDGVLGLIKPDLVKSPDCASLVAQGEREASKGGTAAKRR